MYATPVVYPLSSVTGKLRMIVMLNPMTPVVESFKSLFLGAGGVDPLMMMYSWLEILLILLIGLVLFSRVEKNFMDTV
jgi:lipopolysaccharide transport system permease protein